MASTKRGFSVAGIPIEVQPIYLFVIVALGFVYLSYSWVFVASWVAIATASLVVHELGHAIAFRAFGLRPSITLHAMGGLTTASLDEPGAPPFTPVRSIVTSFAGPLAAIVLFGVPAYLLATAQGHDPWAMVRLSRGTAFPDELEILLGQAVYINIGWSLLNLLPLIPLDGGNITASMCEIVAPRTGRRIANVLSIVAAVALALVGLRYDVLGAPLIAAVFIALNVSELLGSRHEAVDREIDESFRALLAFEPHRAEQLARTVLERGGEAPRHREAVELAAWARLAQADVAGTEQLLVSAGPGAAPSASLRGALALAAGRTAEGVSLLAWALANDPDHRSRALGSIAAAQSGQLEPILRELLLLGPAGRGGAMYAQEVLQQTGHHEAARTVSVLLEASVPRPPGW